MRLSVIIPAHNEELFLPACLASIARAAEGFPHEIERVVVLNRCTDRTEEIARDAGCLLVQEDTPNLARIRNAGITASTGGIIITIDADSTMHPRTFHEVVRKLQSGRYVGGGTIVLLERLSLGILCSMALVSLRLLRYGFSFGLFWFRRRDFEAINGYNESLVTIEDVDLMMRLKAHGKTRGQRFGTLWRAPLTTSCRKFDQFGDWYLVQNPDFLRRVFTGTDQEAANSYWYDPRS